jgi:hypothetical protein
MASRLIVGDFQLGMPGVTRHPRVNRSLDFNLGFKFTNWGTRSLRVRRSAKLNLVFTHCTVLSVVYRIIQRLLLSYINSSLLVQPPTDHSSPLVLRLIAALSLFVDSASAVGGVSGSLMVAWIVVSD